LRKYKYSPAYTVLMPSDLAQYSSKEVKAILAEFSTSLNGLSEKEAEKRLLTYGKNVLAEKKKANAFVEFLLHFKSPLILILLAACIISFFVNEPVDAIIIGIMILLSVILDFYLEYNAEKAANKLKESVKTKVLVLRQDLVKEVSAEDICLGDIIRLSAGNLIPADSRIIESKDFFVNQSSLTGESFPVEKRRDLINLQNPSFTDMSNIVFMGTNVISGSASAIVVKTGKETEFGKISEKLVHKEEESDFDRGIKNFGYLIMKATIFLVLFIFLFNSIVKHNVLESFMFAIAVAVGLTPELLPMVMSVTMAQGSLKMSKKGVIVKKLSSIPNFGSMDILCTDKTGTLTEDKIHLIKYTDCFGKESEEVLNYTFLNSFYQTGINNVLDEAVLSFKKIEILDYKKIDEIPFDFVRKKMSVVVQRSNKRFLVTKGAPEEVFNSSVFYLDKGSKKKFTPEAENKIKRVYEDFSKEGFRVLAVANKEVKVQAKYTKKDESDLVLLGFVSFLDPPKKDVKTVIHELHESGVEVKIITGDNELVTKKVCDEIGLSIKGILLGHEISTLTDDALKVRVENTTIFARFSPDEKNRVIHALKNNGHVVGYMGDGINDAPSLRNADVGISVNSAVDVAKEAAVIVLTQKSLDALKDGVLEGRRTFANTMKYIMMGLSSNFGNMFSVAAAVLFLPFLPMLPIQILLNNFIYDFSQITIPSDNVDEEYIRKPRKWDMNFIKKFMFTFGPISSLFDIITFIALFYFFHASPALFQTGWFIESLTTQTLVIYFIRTKKIPLIQSNPSLPLFLSSLICVVIGWILPFTLVGKYFGLVSLPYNLLLVIAGIVLTYFVIVEITKRVFYRFNPD
jgi:P-type Mg2+ transporter